MGLDDGAKATVLRSSSWDNLARIRYHVEETLLHNEAGAPKLIGRTLPEQLTRGATMRTTIFNMVSTMLGSGMLSLPHTFAQLGLLGGLGMMLLIPFVGEITIWFVAFAAESANQMKHGVEPVSTLPAIVELVLGRNTALLSAVSLIILNYGVAVSYCVVIKGLLPLTFQALTGLATPPSQAACLAFVSFTCLFPLSALKTTDQMRWASIVSVVLVYVFVFYIVAAGIMTLAEVPGALHKLLHPTSLVRGGVTEWLQAAPVVGFSYLCHQNVPTFYAEMRRQRSAGATSRWASKATKFRCGSRAAMVVALALYLATGLGGYAAFGTDTKPNVLLNFNPGPDAVLPDASVIGLRAAFVGTMVSTFPTISHGLRTSLHALCLPYREATAAIRWSEAAVLVLLVGLVSNAVDNLGLVFQLVGSTCGSVLMFILPASLFLFGAREEQEGAAVAAADAGVVGRVGDTVLAWLAVLFGLTVLIGSNVVTYVLTDPS